MKTTSSYVQFLKKGAVLFLIFASFAFQQQIPVTTQDSIGTTADEYMTKLTALKKFNGVLLLKKGGKVVLRKAYNMSEDTDSDLFVTEESQFDLRSVAKLFAKASVIDLEHTGLIDRTSALSTYIPAFPRGEEISIQNLMDHSSGLPREFSKTSKNPVDMSSSDVVSQAMAEQLEFEPGSKSQYSNVGYQLLYELIGKRYNSTFINFLRENYFGPLKMNQSGSNFDDPINNKTHYAFGHTRNEDGEISCICSTPSDDLRLGNLYSSVDDLGRFLDMLGQEKYKDLISDGKITHAGGSDGKRAYVERDLQADYEIIFLANYDEIPFEQLVSDLQSILMDKPVSMPKAVNRGSVNIKPEILERYTGTFDVADAGHLMLTIKLERDSLFLYQKGQNNGYLYPESETVFFGDPKSEESIEFKQDSLGNYFMLLDFQGVRWKANQVEN